MEPAALAIVLLALLVLFLRQQKAQSRRIVAQRNLPRELLVPRHYKSFTALENELWQATHDLYKGRAWDAVRFGLRRQEFEILNDYLRGLREDFQRGHRIFGQVIVHSPEIELFAHLESERCRIEASFYLWYALACVRLRTSGITMRELRRLTEIIANLAYRVRTMLAALESSGSLEVVDSILKNS
jgi:hypothetical protein